LGRTVCLCQSTYIQNLDSIYVSTGQFSVQWSAPEDGISVDYYELWFTKVSGIDSAEVLFLPQYCQRVYHWNCTKDTMSIVSTIILQDGYWMINMKAVNDAGASEESLPAFFRISIKARPPKPIIKQVRL